MKKNGWQFIFLVHADFRDDYHALNGAILTEFKVFMNELLNSPPDLNSHGVQMLYIPLWPVNNNKDIRGLPIEKKMYFLEMKKDQNGNPYWERKDEIPLPADNEQVVGWSNFLKKNCYQGSDREICLVLWGHSHGYGIFPELSPTSRNKSNLFDSLSELSENKAKIKEELKNTILNPDKSRSVLTMEELGEIINNVFQDGSNTEKNIALLAAHVCEMANVYFLKPIMPYCRWFIAHQSDIGIPGFNFPVIFDACKGANQVLPDQMAELFVLSFYEKTGSRNQYSKQIDNAALFAINPSVYIELMPLFNDFISTLTSYINEHPEGRKNHLIEARQQKINFSKGSLFFRIDLLAWLTELNKRFPNEGFILDFFTAYENLLRIYIPISYKGTRVENFNHNAKPINNYNILPGGLSIHYPLMVTTLTIDGFFSGPNELSFIRENNWWKKFYAIDFPVPI